MTTTSCPQTHNYDIVKTMQVTSFAKTRRHKQSKLDPCL